ncbi:MAG: hypothetical protein JW967_09085 [Dehalococcoidales bacterium]|nr:hypothetical protein [Dehalococcoidales bacterium]
MVAELRRTGGRIVLFTDDARIYKYFNQVSLTKHKVPYLQNGKMVGIDFYFEKKLRRTIQRIKAGQMPLDI